MIVKLKPGLNLSRQQGGTMYRFSVADYHRMIEAGILTPDHKVELLDGWIVYKMPQNPPHRVTVSRINRWLIKVLPEEDWSLVVQGPITLATSEPEPDFAIARGPDERFENRHPGPKDIVLIIEVADSSVLEDRRDKRPLYAASKIPELWIVNLQSKCVEVYNHPQGGQNPAYRKEKGYSAGETLPLVLDGKKIDDIKVKHLLSEQS